MFQEFVELVKSQLDSREQFVARKWLCRANKIMIDFFPVLEDSSSFSTIFAMVAHKREMHLIIVEKLLIFLLRTYRAKKRFSVSVCIRHLSKISDVTIIKIYRKCFLVILQVNEIQYILPKDRLKQV